MIFKLNAKGHENVSSLHKTTFEITKDENLTKAGDCIIGISSDKSMLDFPDDFKEKIANSDSEILVKLSTKNSNDEIEGFGHDKLSLDHPTDIVCRKSNYVCSRTLMIKSNKAAADLNSDLIKDLANGEKLKVEIHVNDL